MKNRLWEMKRVRDREKIEVVKARLESYESGLRIIEELEDDIEKKREVLVCLKSVFSGTDPVQGGGSSQEDRIIKVLDDLRELEEALSSLRNEINDIDQAIKGLEDEEMIAIVNHVWIYHDDTMRGLARKYNLSKSAIRRKSDVALLALYKKFFG